ncbi:MAG: thioredoxin fold domain-containing protein [Pseudomonadota bacterium]
MYKRLSAVLFLFVAIPLYAAEPAKKHGAYYGGKATEYPSWFKESFLDLREDIREAEKANKRVVIMFTQDNCPYCNLLVERNLSQRGIVDTLKTKFDVIALNMWGDREVTGLDGRTYSEKNFAAALKVQFTPTLMFFDEAGNTILRLNGYVPPARMQAALDWVSGRHEKKQEFRDFVAARELPAKGSGALISEPFFKKTADLRRKAKGAKPLAVFFEQKDCPDCEVLHRRVLADPELRAELAKFDSMQFDMWSREIVTTPDGSRMPVREWAKRLGVNYAPGIVLFDEGGRETIRWESSFRVFHTLGMFTYTSTGEYRKEPSFQRYLSAKAEQIRESGRDVNIWRYADEPLSPKN